ncbi:hypothetical protein pdam_00016103 [Pocillopora damicornis]|uniref:Protein kinase domain-containing protein n=1 Tax=Pocillopora damicornis TaxID=46731 RepID=A0A3M6TQ35_POCDA|nr:hypothetical protein pdam_00016103 [Pocillopora damicornis]
MTRGYIRRSVWIVWILNPKEDPLQVMWVKSTHYQTCDISLNGYPQPNNWLRSKPIGIHGGVKEVDITIEYLTHNCSSYSDNGGKYCKEYFDLYVRQSEQPEEPNPLKNDATYDKTARTAPSALGIRVSQTFRANVKRKYIVLAFHDQGSCTVLYSVAVKYYVCPETVHVGGLVNLPRTMAPANSSEPVVSDNALPKDVQDFKTELALMSSLQPHPHVVKLIGCCIEKDPSLIVLEYLAYGDLLGYLRKSRGIEDTYNIGEKGPSSSLREKDLLSFAWMIADGMNYLASMKPHPHVVKLIGCCLEKDPSLIVLEYLAYGDLFGYLRKSRGIEDTYNTGGKGPSSSLREKDLLSFAWMIADGMNYLASMKIVHRDLAARNLLVGDNKVCKISDFGLARGLEEDIYTRKTQARLPIKWMPPESLFYGTSTSMSDVWSYGIVMWEVFTIGESPYPGKTSRKIANLLQTGRTVCQGQYISHKNLSDTGILGKENSIELLIMTGASSEHNIVSMSRIYKLFHKSHSYFRYSIMKECWEEEPSKRPTFQWLCSAMKRLLDDHKTYVNLEIYDGKNYVNFDMMMDKE